MLSDNHQNCSREPNISAHPDESVVLALDAIRQAALEGADLICFHECCVPGYRGFGQVIRPLMLTSSSGPGRRIAMTARDFNVGVILGTEHFFDEAHLISALVINRDGTSAGFQDKAQLDPSEEGTYTPGVERRLFRARALKFGIAICHQGFRYPETASLGSDARCAGRVSSVLEPGGTGRVPPEQLRRFMELVSREIDAISRR